MLFDYKTEELVEKPLVILDLRILEENDGKRTRSSVKRFRKKKVETPTVKVIVRANCRSVGPTVDIGVGIREKPGGLTKTL